MYTNSQKLLFLRFIRIAFDQHSVIPDDTQQMPLSKKL
jgi:hypothetical protein